MNYFLIILFINFILILYLIYKTTFSVNINNEKFDSINDYYSQDVNSIINMGKYSQLLLNNNDTISLSPSNITINDLNISSSAIIKNNLTNTKLKGIIVIWSGNSTNFPIGWTLCDGTNGTPDLRSQFIVGAGLDANNVNTDYFKLGDKGGLETVTLSGEQIPSHTHPFIITPLIYGDPNIKNKYGIGKGNNGQLNKTNEISYTGGGGSHNNIPPYYALCYIMKL
jgi:microcystin-dependent protein